jgi:transcriptional regulator with XRE-family HTH domain
VENFVRGPIEKYILNYVACRVKSLRNERKWTQEDLANESEVSLAQIKRIELGKVNLSLLAFFKIIFALEITIDEFFETHNSF